MIQQIENRSELEKFPESRLPSFTIDEASYVQGTFDFFGLNHYSTYLISDKDYPISVVPSYIHDIGVEAFLVPNAKPTSRFTPWGLRKLLNWIKNEYDNPLIYITENGYPDTGELDDNLRVLFLKVNIFTNALRIIKKIIF